MSAAPSFFIETYGCQMNAADAQLMAGVLLRDGFVRAPTADEAEVVIVNTCAVRDHAEQRVLGRVGELKRTKRAGDVLGVVGCMAQRLGERLLERAPHVDFVAGPDAYRQLPQLVGRAREGERAADTALRPAEHYEDVVPERASAASAWVTVQRGCDYRCTFCIVPMTRGPERSRRLADVVREARQLAERGVSEVTLLGQTVNSYHDGDHDFADLLRAVGAVDGVRRLRFTSPHPNDFSDRVVAAMAEVPAVCEHVHLPAQSGSSAVLRRMLRRYTREEYLAVAARLRAAIPDLALTTDLIVGFPGETDDDFAATLALVDEAGFDDAFTFRFSPRAGTAATRLGGGVPDDVAAARLERLIAAVRRTARARNAALVGTTHEILVEQAARRGASLQGRTRQHRVAILEGPAEWIGTYRTVRFTGTTGATFSAVPVEPAPAARGRDES
ncbi:MAG TPA: tRNA (N6-isopentenyl adenosine(37)-C2)-methylthiotransferase MiaB [Gemmatimonadales bacterium]|nr:tRNA (N6-isopentenyl adenosine(37)-C2)-methylthiotransferase MiaB [Gemmatimonadales bacterium]